MSGKSTLEQLKELVANRFWPVVIAFAVLNAGGWYFVDLSLKNRVREELHELNHETSDARANAISASRDALAAQRLINEIEASINKINASIIESKREAQTCLIDIRARQGEAAKLEHLKREITDAQNAIVEYKKLAETVERWRKEHLLSSIRVGMAVPYFGDGPIPDGFIEIRTGGTWPDAAFVAEHLRGKRMELGNDGWLLGYANNLKEIGVLYKEGKVTVDGSAFTIAEVETDRQTSPPGPPWNGIQGVGVGDFDKRLINEHQNGGEPIKGGQHFDSVPPHTYKDKSASGNAGGTYTVALDKRESLPLHLMCRLILRIQ
jgi:hypothetical protein